MTQLTDLITDYLNHAIHERGLAVSTVKGSQAWLRNFTCWLEDSGYPSPTMEVFTVPVLRRYQYTLSGKGYRPRTLHSVFYSLRSFGDFLVTSGVLTVNPVKSLTLPKNDAARRLTVSEEEIEALLEACERQRTPQGVAFSRAMLMVFIFCGLRRQECFDLRVSDVMLSDKSLLVRSGKGAKSRKVFLSPPVHVALAEWLAVRPTAHHDWLWYYDPARRIGEVGFKRLLDELKAVAGYKDADNIKPHSLRHACATRLLRHGANIKDIQVWLGHSQLSTTAQYLHSSEEQLRSIADLSQLPQKKEEQKEEKKPEREYKRVRRPMR